MALLPFRGEIDRIGRVNADQLKRGGDEPPIMEIAEANGARNVAVGVEVQLARQARDRPLRAIYGGERGPHLLAIGGLAVGAVQDVGATQGIDQHAGGVMRAGCNPTRRRFRQRRIGGGEGLRRRAGAVENERRRRVEILGEKTGILLFLRLLDKILQITVTSGTRATSPTGLSF
jgi:hypothetical protein